MQIKLYLSNEIDTIKQYFQETLQIIEAVIYKMVGAVAFFRKKIVGMARRAVRILQRSPPRSCSPLILPTDSRFPAQTPFFAIKEPDFRKYVNMWD